MKKLFLVLLLGALTIGVQAQNFVARDFMQGNQAIFVTNATTFTYGEALVPYTNASGAAVYSGVGRYSTNGLIAPGTWSTNSYVSYPNAWGDVMSMSDRDGNNASMAVGVSLVGVTATSTNNITLVFTKMINLSSPQVPSTPNTAAQDKFTVTVVPNGTTAVAISTNIPAAIVQGAAGWRLLSIASADHGAAGSVMIKQITLNGYQP